MLQDWGHLPPEPEFLVFSEAAKPEVSSGHSRMLLVLQFVHTDQDQRRRITWNAYRCTICLLLNLHPPHNSLKNLPGTITEYIA
jgi:hypothetical protein